MSKLTAAIRRDAEHGAVLLQAVGDCAADSLHRRRCAEPHARRRRPRLIHGQRGVFAHRRLGKTGLRATHACRVQVIDVSFQRPAGAAIGAAHVGNTANTPIARQLVAAVARYERGAGAEARYRVDLIDAEVRQPLAALVVEAVVATLRVVRNELIAPGHIGVDAKDARVLQDPSLRDRRVHPCADGIVLAVEAAAVEKIGLNSFSVVSPSGGQEAGGG